MEHLSAYRIVLVTLAVLGTVVGAIVYRTVTQNIRVDIVLAELWQNYKQTSWDNASGRTIDHQSGDVTTSEGQAYTMLRAAWMDDQPTFAATWDWTVNNLQRPDKLFSWRWGRNTDGTWGILKSQGGDNSASDADTDIALALLMAGNQWHAQSYSDAAHDIITNIWQHEVVTVHGKPYLAADNAESASNSQVVLNPSYLSPYAYRVFAQVDHSHPWNDLINGSYAVIDASSERPLGADSSANLPPDWVALNTRTGQLEPVQNGSGQHVTAFGYDAFRVLWRLGLDQKWAGGTTMDKATLGRFSFLDQQWRSHRSLSAQYGHDGHPLVKYESLVLYGGSLGYFTLIDNVSAQQIVAQKLLPLYDQRAHRFTASLTYYDNNWVWFGIALYANELPNLTGKAVRS